MVKVGIGSEAATSPDAARRPAPVPPSPEAIARHFPQLELIELLGSGGMGVVYKARQREIDRLAALKILPSEAAGDPGFAERFTREARALARLSHPNIVGLYDFGHVNGLHYFIMEYVDGLNLRQLEQAGKLAPREALQIIPQICEALQFAHDEGIVHRDIKPENVLLDKKGRVKIADFGLARILGHEPEDFRLTRAREVMGTPHYMAPEQVEKPQTVDHRADIYSLGVVFYEMLTGELPLGKFLPPSQKVQIDVRLDDVVLRALEKEPGRRYQHASEVKTDMETILTKPPASSAAAAFAPPGSTARRTLWRRRLIIPAAAGTVLVLAIGLLWARKRMSSVAALEPPAAVLAPTLAATATVAPNPEAASGWYYVSGEVRTPSRRAYDGRVTLLQAITSAGDFTDFADKERVRLTRADGHSEIINCLKALEDPSLDLDIHPGDTIHVGRRSNLGAAPATPAPAGDPFPSPEMREAFARRYGIHLPPASPAKNAPPGFPVAPSGVAPLSYQWQFPTNGTSEIAMPGSASNVDFAVAAAGTNPVSYQWYKVLNDSTTTPPAPGPEGLTVTKLTPLYLKLTLENVVSSDSGPRYVIGVEREAATTPRDRTKRQYYCALHTGGLPDLFTLLDVRAPQDCPTNITLVLELKGFGQLLTLSRDHPFQRLEGYMADLEYAAKQQIWINRRVGSTLAFAGDVYEILAVTPTDVVLRQKSNNKTCAVTYHPAVRF
jgi:predicted Ser/Thr protein kinase